MIRSVYIYIFVMAAVTYIIRVLPLAVFRKPIRNRFVRSFLYYVPYVTLSVMTFPAILDATGSYALGAVGFAVAMAFSLYKGSLPLVAAVSCLAVYLLEFFL
ncbi:MAG: AzlD domain-containing protein [Bullifex sp.]